MNGAVWSWAALRRHAAFDSHAFDLGIFTNAIWNLIHGNGFYSSVKGGMSLFADHQSPLFWLLAPVFALFPSPKTLLIVQAFGLAATAIPLFFLGRQYLESRQTGRVCWELAALPLMFWLYLPVRNATQFDFHPEVFMLPLFLAAIAGLQARSLRARIAGSLFLVLALMGKESAGPVAAGIGLAWVLGAGPEATRSFTRRVGFAVILLGTTVFFFDVKIVPRLLGVDYAYGGLYSQFGGGLSDILLAPFTKPLLFLQQIFGPARLAFLFWTLAPLAFLPLLNPRAAVAAIPGYLMLFLAAGDHKVDVSWHYGIEPGVGLLWALPLGLAQVDRWMRISPRSRIFGTAWILIWVIATVGKPEIIRGLRYKQTDYTRWLHAEFLPCVDPEMPLAASDALVPHLATRRWIHRPDFLGQSRENADCLIYDSSLSNWPMTAEDESKMLEQMRQPPWEPVFEKGTLKAWCAKGGPHLFVQGCVKF